MDAREVAKASLFAILTAVVSPVVVYVGPVPYTLQNFAIVLSGIILGPKLAAISQLIYLSLIAAGAPLASGFRGGVRVLFGYTGGYLIAFPLSAYLNGVLTRRYVVNEFRLGRALVASLAAASPLYIMGSAVFAVYALYLMPGLLNWSVTVATMLGLPPNPVIAVIVASSLIFIPQDVLVDHLLAILVGRAVVSRVFKVTK